MNITASNKPYRPYGGALQMFYSKAPEILFEGPAGTGKTRAVLEKAHLCAEKYDGCRILLVRKTRKSLTESVLVTYEEKVLPERSYIKKGAGRDHRHSYHYNNGSTIVLGGMDNPDRIMSTEYDLICSFESTELNEDDGEKLTTRLRNGVMPYQQWIADCNPGAPTHWLNRRAASGLMVRVYSRHEDNPSVTPAYLDTLQRLTGARKARLYEGRWASQEGLVYEFDPLINMCNPFAIPADWPKYRVIDFGYNNPFVCQWWAESPDDINYMYREIYYSHRIVSQHAEQIKKYSQGEKYIATIADHDAEDRATLHASGIQTIAAIKDITSGIDTAREKLSAGNNGKASIVIFHDALIERDQQLFDEKRPVCTREEFDSYSYPKNSKGLLIKEAPNKVDDHGMDCLRYLNNYKYMQVKHPRPRYTMLNG